MKHNFTAEETALLDKVTFNAESHKSCAELAIYLKRYIDASDFKIEKDLVDHLWYLTDANVEQPYTSPSTTVIQRIITVDILLTNFPDNLRYKEFYNLYVKS